MTITNTQYPCGGNTTDYELYYYTVLDLIMHPTIANNAIISQIKPHHTVKHAHIHPAYPRCAPLLRPGVLYEPAGPRVGVAVVPPEHDHRVPYVEVAWWSDVYVGGVVVGS